MFMVVKEMERKVTRIGNSYGITFPNALLKRLGLSHGDHVYIEERDGEIVIRKSRKVQLPKGISPDFFDVLERNVNKHEETIKGLVDR